MADTKGRILFLERYMLEHTDDEHSIRTDDLIRIYEENGCSIICFMVSERRKIFIIAQESVVEYFHHEYILGEERFFRLTTRCSLAG